MTQNERSSMPIWKKVLAILISLALLAVQILFFKLILYDIRKFEQVKYVYWFFYAFSAVLCLMIVSKHINIGYKLTWIFFIMAFPFMGSVIYLFFGDGRTLPRKKQKIIDEYLKDKVIQNNHLSDLKNEDLTGYGLASLLHKSTNMPIYKNNDVEFFKSGKLKHEQLLEELNKAEEYIFLEYFIVSEGKCLEDIIEVLERKSAENVEIKFLYDSVGSNRFRLKRRTIKRLLAIKNLTLVDYNPVGLNINLVVNYRDHRKIVIIDGHTAFVGGDNLADEYIDEIRRFGYWRDNAIMVKGDAVNNFLYMFFEMWFMSCHERLDLNKYIRTHTYHKEQAYCLPFGDGPTNTATPGYDLYMSMFGAAKKSLYISTPYLIIDQEFIDAIARAAKRGVDVVVLTPEIPDKKIVFQITRTHYKRLLECGAKVYEYAPGFNHAKNVIVDGKYAFLGTINMDYRSLFLHFECGALLINDKCILDMEKDFLEAISLSTKIDLETHLKRPMWQKLIGFIAGFINPAL